MPIRSFKGINPQISANCYVDKQSILIGDVAVKSESSIWPGVVIRADINSVTIAEKTNIQDNTVIHVTHASKYNPSGYATNIGSCVTVGHKSILHGCKIYDNCLIGMGSIIMDGAIVHENVIIGAGSIVSPGKTLESGYLWLGSPAKKVRKLTNEELEFIQYSANHYAKLGLDHKC